MRTFPPALLVLALLMIGGNPAHAQTATTGGPTPSPPSAKVYFVDLRDGAVIGPKTTIHFGLHGMKAIFTSGPARPRPTWNSRRARTPFSFFWATRTIFPIRLP
jgi:hypothetical protein